MHSDNEPFVWRGKCLQDMSRIVDIIAGILSSGDKEEAIDFANAYITYTPFAEQNIYFISDKYFDTSAKEKIIEWFIRSRIEPAVEEPSEPYLQDLDRELD